MERQDALHRFRLIVERLEIDGWRRRDYSEHPAIARFERVSVGRLQNVMPGRNRHEVRMQLYDVWIDEHGVVQEAFSVGRLSGR